MPKFGRTYFDQALTDVSLGFPTQDFVAERIFPPILVDRQTGQYFIHGRDSWTIQDDLRQPGDEAKLAHWRLADAPYWCDGHALKDYVPWEDPVNANPQLDLMIDTTEFLTEKLLRNQEFNLVATLAAGMVGASLANQVGTPWNDNENDPVAIITAQAAVIGLRIGRMPNKFVCSQSVWNVITANQNVTNRITGAPSLEASRVTPQQFASLIEVDEVIVARATLNQANQGQPVNPAWIWGNNALLAYVPTSPGRKTMSLGYTFKWGNAFGTGLNQFVHRYKVDERLADAIEVHKYYSSLIVAMDAGVWFTNCHP